MLPRPFEVLASRFFIKDDPREDRYVHWSRVYEWRYVLDMLRKYRPRTVHNTACGGLNSGDCLHLTFCADVSALCPDAVHSDLWGGGYPGTETKPPGDRFEHHDITEPHDRTFDFVLNVSTIEHLPKDKVTRTLDNLLRQVAPGGHLILTFDFPDIDLQQIVDYFGVMFETPTNYVTNGRLAVVLVHVVKS